MKTVNAKAPMNKNTGIAQVRQPMTKVVMETQDLVNHRIVLSVLHNRELQKLSPAAVLGNLAIFKGLTKAEIARVTYLFSVEQEDVQFAQTMKTTQTPVAKTVVYKKAPLSKIMIEKQDLVADEIDFTVLHNRDLVKLSPMALLKRADILTRLNKQEIGRTAYLAGVEFGILKSRAEALMA